MDSTIKVSATTLVVAVFATVLLGTGSAQAILAGGSDPRSPVPFTLMFDETGEGSIQIRAPMPSSQRLRGQLLPDPTAPVGSPRQALTWVFNFLTPESGFVAVGDVRITAGGVLSDLLRF
jgi:hypothetical protein